jgi:hypothetical protein
MVIIYLHFTLIKFLDILIEFNINAAYRRIPEMHLKSAGQRADFMYFWVNGNGTGRFARRAERPAP